MMPDRHGRRGVAHPAVFDDADVELHDVAILNAPRAADPVHDFFVHRDADIARESRGSRERRSCSPSSRMKSAAA